MTILRIGTEAEVIELDVYGARVREQGQGGWRKFKSFCFVPDDHGATFCLFYDADERLPPFISAPVIGMALVSGGTAGIPTARPVLGRV